MLGYERVNGASAPYKVKYFFMIVKLQVSGLICAKVCMFFKRLRVSILSPKVLSSTIDLFNHNEDDQS